MNTGAPWPSLQEAKPRVLEIQTKLHKWATADAKRRFDDLYNLVYDPAFLVVAWNRVRTNRGARTAGVDGETARYIERERGMVAFLDDLRADLKARTFEPLPAMERVIPKPGSAKGRRLGIPATRDRVVQASLKLVLEPILEADFQPCSYGFRLRRRPHDAIAEIHLLATNSYEWVLEADIEACFDRIDHPALMDRMRRRVGDRRVLALIKAFLKAGILSEDGITRDTNTGTPQGGILSPLLANVALSALDDHFAEAWASFGKNQQARSYRRSKGLPTYRLVRYADDLVVMVSGTPAQAEQLRDQVEAVLGPIGLRLSEAKTRLVHIDEGFDFLGFRIRRDRKEGTNQKFVYTYPSKKALGAIKRKVRTITNQGTNQALVHLIRQLNAVLRGWTNYFRHGVSKATFGYLRHFVWQRVVGWLRRKHRRANWKQLRRRYLVGTGLLWPADGDMVLFDPGMVAVTRYRYRGNIPSPWAEKPARS